MLLRAPAASRALLRPLQHPTSSHALRPAFTKPTQLSQTPITRFCTATAKSSRPHVRRIAVGFPHLQQQLQLQSSRSQSTTADAKHEKELQGMKLKATPETVSTSSTISVSGERPGQPEAEEQAGTGGGIRQDFETIKETFNLSEVPREAYVLGLAGVLPYFATSAGTIYCAWEINHAATYGSGFLMSGGMAEALLHVLEPLQIGYGAVIISFLGAIHWGLEWAQFGGKVGYPRYAIGVLAPAVAWPSLLLPVNTALIAQFAAFVFLYYADSRASRVGWAPSWYSMYRFVLTFIVGASIVASLIGRGEIAHMVGQVPKATTRIQHFRESAAEELSREEMRMREAQEKTEEHQ